MSVAADKVPGNVPLLALQLLNDLVPFCALGLILAAECDGEL
jgi:hypothetical protein